MRLVFSAQSSANSYQPLPFNHLANQLSNCFTAEGAELAEETRKEKQQFSVLSSQERQLLAFNPSPSVKGEAR